MVLRILISGRPPVTNMYETIIFVSWGGVLFALVFELVYRVRYFATTAAALATIALLIADNVPIFDASISPLVPVLRDNMWLTDPRAHDHARLRGVHARDGPRPPEPRPLLLRPRQGRRC